LPPGRPARGLVGGYPDRTFRPDHPITRAEFVALVNRAFGYTEMTTGVTFYDVAETDWYAAEFAKAAHLGYIGGYADGTTRPQNLITRQEVAAVLTRILPPAEVEKVNAENNTDGNFTDQAQIPEWSKAAIAAVVKVGHMSGYPDGTFQPDKAITRAEAIAVLNRAAGTIYNRAGTYGPFQGTKVQESNVTINTPGVTLQNTTIKGNLYLTEGIGEGDVTLINVTVQGNTKVAAGGKDSIHLRNTSVGAVLVDVPSRNLVRLLAQGNTTVGTLEARTPVRLEEEKLTGSGFTKVIVKTQKKIEGNITKDSPAVTIELLGQFDDVRVQSTGTQLNLQKGSIANLTLASTAQLTQISLAAQTGINSMTADAPVTVQGQGTVETTLE